MAKFVLKSRLNSLLKNPGKPPIVEISFLGIGGAFDLKEKNSSVIIKTSSGTVLIDCGYSIYQELRNKNFIKNIDYIFITHCHEDHIGSLSTLIYHKFFTQKQPVKIECIPSLKPKLEMYLNDVCGQAEGSFIINSNGGILYEDLNMIIHKIETTDHHFKDLPSSGFVFNFKKGGENLFLIYSGDINTPITGIIKEKNPELYESLIKCPENVFVLHESTSKDYPPFYPHCDYKKLEEETKTFPNIYLYHHSEEEAKEILKTERDARRRLEVIKKTIDSELNKKLLMVNEYERKEKLRIQAKRLKDDFTEDFSKSLLKTKDLSLMGKELIIQEEMGL